MPLVRIEALSQFTCLGDKCPDTCCKGWSMQVDPATLTRYETSAPELLNAVETAEESPVIMRKDPESGYCVMLQDGLCGIHKNYGESFLGDACFFYPRVTRRLGDKVVMTALQSCPEIARLAASSNAAILVDAPLDRLPGTTKDYLPSGMSEDAALAIHHSFLTACDDASATPERIYMRIMHVSNFLDNMDKASWAEAVPFFLKQADGQLPPADATTSDPFNLLHALCGLTVATKKRKNLRLIETITEMERAMSANLNWEDVTIGTSDESVFSYVAMAQRWKQEGAARYSDFLRHWLKMELSVMLYPFSGLGETLKDRAVILGVRYATVRLGLMSAYMLYGNSMKEEVPIRVVQSVARLLNHLADPEFSLKIYSETGWIHESRMRGLIEI